MNYRGRFAPSPTGALHFGSLIAALASCLEARAHGGEWLVRMEDVDAPRTAPGAAEGILACLEAHGFIWNGEILWQSRRLEAYQAALDDLRAKNLAYGCACSRKEIAERATARAIDGGLLYSGTCRHGTPSGRLPRAWRLRVENADIDFSDPIQGTIRQNIARDVGDFVLLRADCQFAYQLAVVVDDAFQGITHVVRGADLLDSTPRQIYLQACLDYAQPEYLHVPVATNAAGEKLSKQTGAKALDVEHPAANLVRALNFLGQHPPQELAQASVREVWEWALGNWQREKIPRCQWIRDQ
ncbi:glutamyl-Q tRNA(Asp) synthetase [Betaproteobacteria bacterium]|nr:glutamyl-Q tRNA(Asp) synthetase [Betaproteobacteria bacterium]GHU40986.1 glutamyl-Q tRNA(Asp) synthetase [Betaproteobacteria bacterium]